MFAASNLMAILLEGKAGVEIDNHWAIIFGDHDVAWVDVVVNEAKRVHMANSARNTFEVVIYPRGSSAPAKVVLAEMTWIHSLHKSFWIPRKT